MYLIKELKVIDTSVLAVYRTYGESTVSSEKGTFMVLSPYFHRTFILGDLRTFHKPS